MFRRRKTKMFFKDKVKKLMRRQKNEKLKSIIENENSYSTLRDSTGTTLLHIAARYDNAEMIRYSINAGCEIDAKDSSGTTPLTIATKFNHCSAMKLLLDANADIFVTNSAEEYPLQLMFNPNKAVFYSSIHKIYYEKVKTHSSSDEEVVEILLNAGCALDQVVIMQDPKMTRLFLERLEGFDPMVSCRSVLISTFLIDNENLEILLHHGPQVTQRIEDFLWYLLDICHTGVIQTKQINFFGQSRILDTVTVFAKKIIDWDVIDQQNLKYLKYIFEDAGKDILEIFLEFGIHDYVQNRFSYNLIAHVYGNRNPDIIQFLRDKKFNKREYFTTGQDGNTALHIAVFRCIPNNVKFLLDTGADPNTADEIGETPLFCVLNCTEPLTCRIECIELLLQSNADVEICDELGSSFIEYVDLGSEDHLSLAEPVLAHLAMLEATTVLRVKQSILEYIDKHDQLKTRFDTCRHQLEEMKIRTVTRSFNLMTVMTSEPDKIARFVGAQIGKIISTLLRGKDLRKLNEHYAKRFKERLNRALETHMLRCEACQLIEDSFLSFKGCHPVLDKIISYFDFDELLAFTHRLSTL